MKEKFKYEVDRSSPSNKLREFMDWSKDIMEDIKYTRRVLDNRVSRFFVRLWYVNTERVALCDVREICIMGVMFCMLIGPKFPAGTNLCFYKVVLPVFSLT